MCDSISKVEPYGERRRVMEGDISCWGEGQERTKRMVLSILGGGAERVRKVAACKWCHHDLRKRVRCSASRTCMRCESVVKLKQKLPECCLPKPACFL